MADVLDYVAGTPFTVRVRSSLVTNPRVRWHNTFELRATESGDVEILGGAAAAIVGLVISMTYDYVRVDEVTLSTWVPDSHPYNPLGFFTGVYNQRGLVPLGFNTPAALREALFVKRQTTSGLLGKLFLRGAIILEDLTTVDGEWVLNDPAPLATRLADAIVENDLGVHLAGLASPSWAFALIGNDGETRWINTFALSGLSDIKMNHKYFDRSPTP